METSTFAGTLAEGALANFAVVVILLTITLSVQRGPSARHKDCWGRWNGLALGAIAVATMALPIHGAPGHIMDLRAVPLILAAPAFGPFAGLISAGIGTAGEILLNPAAGAKAYADLAVAAALGLATAWAMDWRGLVRTTRRAEFRLVHAMLLALAAPLAVILPEMRWQAWHLSFAPGYESMWTVHALLALVTTGVAGLVICVHIARGKFENALEEASEQLRTIAANIPGVIYRRAPGSRGEPIFRYVSERCRDVFGVPAQSFVNSTMNLMALIHPEDYAYLRRAQKSALDIDPEPLVTEFRIIRPDGQVRWIQSRSQINQAASDAAGEVIAEGIAFDVTEQKEGHAAAWRAAWLAEHDPLTGCLNRHALELRMKEAGRAPMGEDRVLILINLRDSRRVNELFGSEAGDRRIAEAARRLTAAAPRDAIVARTGGDEFAIFSVAAPAGTTPVLALQDALDSPMDLNGQTVPLRADFGSADAKLAERGPDDLMKAAAAALDEARRADQPTALAFTRDMEDRRTVLRRLDADLGQAIAGGALDLCLQPIVSVPERSLLGHEALVRWRGADGNWIAPSIFVPRAEALGLWPQLDEWVLRRACRDAAQHPNAGWISVNLSAGWFMLGDLVPLVKNVLAESGLPPRRLCLELTERVLIEDFANARAVIEALKAIGVSVAIDDFGSVYSSLTYLYTLPVDEVKIDKVFIDDVATDRRLQAMVRSLITLFGDLGMECIAEGVETQEQFDWLACNGCKTIQGYLTGRPRMLPRPEAAQEEATGA